MRPRSSRHCTRLVATTPARRSAHVPQELLEYGAAHDAVGWLHGCGDDDAGDDVDGAASCETVIVRHAPQISGTVDGTIRQLLPESTSINGSGVVTGDLLIPGSPTVRLNGNPDYDGTVDETGATSPTNHRVTLNGNAQLRHTIRRVDAIPMPTVAAPTAPTGVLDVTFTNPSQTVGSWADVRNLTLSGQAYYGTTGDTWQVPDIGSPAGVTLTD